MPQQRSIGWVHFYIWLTITKWPTCSIIYDGQSIENRTSATKWQWNLFYSKIIGRSVNTFIPLGDETINSSLIERGRSLMDPQSHPLLQMLHFHEFLQIVKNVESQGERSGLYGGCLSVFKPNIWSLSLTILAVWERVLSCKRMISFDSIPGL